LAPISAAEDAPTHGVVAFRGDREGGPNPYDILILERAARLASLAFAREATNRQLRRAATEDHLTGLASRRGFDDEFDRMSAGDVELPVALVFIDLDGFKDLNDRHGHDFGDAVLEAVGQRLQRAVRPGDVVARLGGDEFVVLAAGVDEISAGALESRVAGAVSGIVSARGFEAPIGASIGLAMAHCVEELGGLLRRADAAMYRNKQRHNRRNPMVSGMGLRT
jgi:diguanylate cyclase (GGDEF)-like protein